VYKVYKVFLVTTDAKLTNFPDFCVFWNFGIRLHIFKNFRDWTSRILNP